MATTDSATVAADSVDDRHEAVSEILRELSGDGEPEAPPEPAPPGSPAEESPPSMDELLGVEPDEAAASAGALAGGPAPGPAPIGPTAADPQPVPEASPPRSLILLHAFLLVTFAVGTWLTYRQVSQTLNVITTGIRERPIALPPVPPAPPAAEPARTADPPAAPKARGADLSLRTDDGVRYLREVEKADVLFQKGQFREAAAVYQRALEIVPLDLNDGAAAFHLGECHARLQEFPQAVTAFEAVSSGYPSPFQPRALYQLGLLHVEARAYPKAREAFYALLLRRARFGPDAAPLVEEATYRVADTYWLEAEALARSKRGAE